MALYFQRFRLVSEQALKLREGMEMAMIHVGGSVPVSDIPPRSVLYRLEPRGPKSPEIECLTSYINRLAWAYGIGPRLFIADAILPELRGSHSVRLFPNRLAPFCRQDAIGINAAGLNAADWSVTLEQLTGYGGLRDLTVCSWASDLPPRGLLRKSPAWCSWCYTYWRENDLPVYQPLYWMFQVVKTCMKHRKWLEELCPNCQMSQSAIATTTRPGYCTQCVAWLGTPSSFNEKCVIEEDIIAWQEWVVNSISELHRVGTTTVFPEWTQCSAKLAVCAQVVGGTRQLARIVGLPPSVPRHWIIGESLPSFKCLLELCYVLNISPLELISSSREDLVSLLQANIPHSHPSPDRLTYNQVDDERTLRLINAILDGKEAPLGVRQVERSLGLGEATLLKRFPTECALLTAKYQAYRTECAKLRVERDCEEVRQATITLHKQGIHPSKYHLAKRLSDPDLMRRPECREIWHRTRRELGLEP